MNEKDIADEVSKLAMALISRESVTPEDNGCQDILIKELTTLGFNIERLNFNEVSNFWARRGDQDPLFLFSGHTDVVPPGPLEKWRSPPFTPTIEENCLFGRGAADMKSALAAMIIACKYFLAEYPETRGSIGFAITSDEEGNAQNGTANIVKYLKKQGINPTWCLIGEASSQQELGDAIKIGRRGSLHGFLQVIGKQGHIAYPHLAENPIHRSFKALDELTKTHWDSGNDFFTPTSFQIYNIMADTGASNIIPGALTARFNFRFSPASTAEQLQQHVYKVLDNHDLNYKIDWEISGHPFFSPPGILADACKNAIKKLCNREANLNTTGGTSDGRFIADLDCEIVELGPPSKSIHQVNEHIKLDDLIHLTILYRNILKSLFNSC